MLSRTLTFVLFKMFEYDEELDVKQSNIQSQIQITNPFIFLIFAINNELFESSLFQNFIPKSLNNEDFCVFGQNLGRF